MPARIFVEQTLRSDAEFSLPPGPTRHVQVLRLQPGASLTVFDGRGGEYAARVLRIGRGEVRVQVGTYDPVERELACPVTLAPGMPANERMDALVEKATELGAAVIVPLVCERSVLRLQGERAERKRAHWRGVAIAACEQSGRTRLPEVEAVTCLATWLRALPATGRGERWLLSPGAAHSLAGRVTEMRDRHAGVLVLSGPEGGLTPAEEALARECGFSPVGLGPRVLRADTAPVAVLAGLALLAT